jgi:putative oxidoreductase
MLRFFGFFNSLFGAIGSWFQSPILLLLRLFFGISFMYAGLGKLQDIQKFHDLLVSLNIPYPEWGAWGAALTEFIGGILLAAGFFSRFAAFALIIVMGVAYGTAHVASVQALTTNPQLFVAEAPFNFLLTALLVWAFGPGFFSLDQFLLSKPKEAAKPKEPSKTA